jgi:uncharacterized protein DUF4189
VNASRPGRDNLKEIVMNTNRTKTSMGRRITAAALLGSAIAAGALGAAATANARPPLNPGPGLPPRPAAGALTSSIAYSPETGIWASWTNAPSTQNADFAALNVCQDRNGTHCSIVGRAGNNQCVALAVDAVNWNLYSTGFGSSVVDAETAAIQGPNSRIATVACTSPGGARTGFSGKVGEPQV